MRRAARNDETHCRWVPIYIAYKISCLADTLQKLFSLRFLLTFMIWSESFQLREIHFNTAFLGF